MSTDRNLLFGVLALQADLISPPQFAEGCSVWAGRKDAPLADLLVERGWLAADDVALVNRLLEKKLAKHGGDAQATLAAEMADEARQTLAFVSDPDIRATLAADGPQRGVLLTSGTPGGGSRDRYSTTRLHATGGLGRVWLARDIGMNRDVALKELLPERAGLPSAAERFLREARITGQLEHPGIVPVYEMVADPAAESPFYTMRFIRGRTLGEGIADYHRRRAAGTSTPLELRELLSAFVLLCQAVAYAHSRRVIHRDLKPANVVLGDFGEVILLDWGIAKVLGEPESADPNRTLDSVGPPVEESADDAVASTQAGQVLGTPSYMAPEQAAGEVARIDERTDVYGLGAVLFELLTGTVPFRDLSLTKVLEKVRTESPPRPTAVAGGVPKPLEAVCLKCLSKSPADRYSGAKELAAEVTRFLADEPVIAYRDPLRVRIGRWARRHRTLVAGLAVLLLVAIPVLLVSLVLVSNSADREHTARVAADSARDEAEANFQKAVRAAEVVSEELARGIKPIAGTQSKTVIDILARAESVYDELLAAPNPPARARLNKARMLMLVCEVYRNMNRVRPAIERGTQAVELAKALAAEEPANREYQIALASAHHRRAWAVFDTGAESAQAEFDEAIRLFDAAGVTADTAPEETYALASSLTLGANTLWTFRDAAAARARYERGRALREELYRKAPTPANGTQLATSLERFGLFLKDRGENGLANLRRAVELNAAAFAADRANQEFARSYIRSLNSCAQSEWNFDEKSAVGRLTLALELAETFARRDPDANEWERETIRLRWGLGEIDRKHWGRLPPEKQTAARRAQVALLRDLVRVTEKRLAESPDSTLWLADRANLTGRLGEALQQAIEAGDEPPAARAEALALMDQAARGYERVMAIEPKSFEHKIAWMYNQGSAAKLAATVSPDEAALIRHWRYAKVAIRSYAELHRTHPDDPYTGKELSGALLRAQMPIVLADKWLALSADPVARDALFDYLEVLPDPATITHPTAKTRLTFTRDLWATRLGKLDAQSPLPERGKKLLESLGKKQ